MPYSDATAIELRRAVVLRAHELGEIVAHLRGPLGHSRSSLRAALDLVAGFPNELLAVLDREWAKNVDPASRSQILTTLLRHANFVADFVERHLAHGTRRELSEALVDELHRELDALSLGHYGVVISHGEAFNFTTTYGDLRAAIFGPLQPAGSAPPVPPEPFALFKMPRIEGAGVQWRPVLLGHEVAHVAVRDHDSLAKYDVWRRFDIKTAEGLPNPRAGSTSPPIAVAMGLYRIAQAWATELLCDAHALFRYGPAAVAALAEYFMSIGSLDASAPTHPPAVLRLRLLLDQLGTPSDPRLQQVVRPWDDLTPAAVALTEPWAQYLATMFLANASDLVTTVEAFGTDEYSHLDRSPIVGAIADRLKEGVPGREVVSIPGAGFVVPDDPDVVNAVWVARVEDSDRPFDTLGKKALESLEFSRRWVQNGGQVPFDLYEPLPAGTPLDEEDGVATISAKLLARRLRLDDDRRLVVLPLVHRPKGAAIDLRLGNRFIVFRRTGTASFDPLESEDDPRSIQVHLELAWSETFVLHPQEVVLGATLEYLVLPADLAGQVVTRSSYGRLGLLSATAVQIHPRFHGCLTLELVNLSTIPITLTPGERIAQLVLWRTAEVDATVEKYSYPIGPEFSRVRDDPEADVLRALRRNR
jgi:deoxycytidine triphosphate deaminase